MKIDSDIAYFYRLYFDPRFSGIKQAGKNIMIKIDFTDVCDEFFEECQFCFNDEQFWSFDF